LLLNLETHRPIDLLDDRTADVFANWLRRHPGVEIIVRDRAGAYAEGGRQGAPNAIQVADRFHLSANASAALDEVLRSRRRHMDYVVRTEPAEQLGPTPTAPLPPFSRTQQNLAIQRTRRGARWDEVRTRRAAGYGIARIAREMRMHRRTVRRYAAAPLPPCNRPPEHPKPGGLSSPTLQPLLSTRKVGGRPGVPTSLNCNASWRRRGTAVAIPSSCKHSSRGAVHVRRQNPVAVVVAAGRVSSASMYGGCVFDRRTNLSRTSVRHCTTLSTKTSDSPADTRCCSVSVD
jgi:hypothetical protein